MMNAKDISLLKNLAQSETFSALERLVQEFEKTEMFTVSSAQDNFSLAREVFSREGRIEGMSKLLKKIVDYGQTN